MLFGEDWCIGVSHWPGQGHISSIGPTCVATKSELDDIFTANNRTNEKYETRTLLKKLRATLWCLYWLIGGISTNWFITFKLKQRWCFMEHTIRFFHLGLVKMTSIWFSRLIRFPVAFFLSFCISFSHILFVGSYFFLAAIFVRTTPLSAI